MKIGEIDTEKISADWYKKLRIYFIAFSFIWIAASILLIQKGYHGSFLYLNAFHTPFLDNIMPHLTQFGDSLIVCSIILLLFSKRNISLTLCTIIAILGSGLILICLKQFLFSDWHRPLTVLKGNTDIHYIKGYVEYHRSFPSGHATTIASAIPFLSLFIKGRAIIFSIMLAILTSVLCYTRVYLGSHFLGDILVGSMLGSLCALLVIFFAYLRIRKRLYSITETRKRKTEFISMAVGLIALSFGILTKYFI